MDTSISTLLDEARIATTNAAEVQAIAAALNTYGFTQERLQEGRTLYEAALASNSTKQQQYGNQYDSTAKLNEQLDTLADTYTKHLKIARIAITQPGQAQALSLLGPRKRPFAARLAQIKQFYTNALSNPDILAALAKYNITKKILEDTQTDIAAVETTSATREQLKGAAQAATQTRNEHLKQLETWMKEFRTIAKIALKDEPQLLESLGILVRT